MLVSFHESYLFLVEVCALFCILTMVYSLFSYLTQGLQKRHQKKKVEAAKKILETYPVILKKKQERQKRKLAVILRKPKGLLALSKALDEIGWKDSTDMYPAVRRLLCEVLTEEYLKVYQKEDEAVQGLLISLITRCDASSSRLKQILLKNLEARNLLVRIETLRCICAQRNRKLMLQAIQCINEKPQYFNNKLLTDVLIEFKGNRQLLMEQMWENLWLYSADIQVSILQMMTILRAEEFSENVFGLVDDETVNKETRIAAIKYFGNVHMPKYALKLSRFLTDPVWEYGAVAAKVLEEYDCTEIFPSLLEGSSSRNWYVRNNCARTIVLSCRQDQIEKALLVKDRYTRDSIRYALEIKEREAEAV